MYLFTDAQPSDWLESSDSDRWHTIAYLAIPSMPHFEQVAEALRRLLPLQHLRRWRGAVGYRTRFKSAFCRIWPEFKPWINAVSFQERTLRAGRLQLLERFNDYTAEGRSIGFAETADERGRPVLRHEYVNFSGYHVIEAPADKVLVLLVLAWFVSSQYWFYRRAAVSDGHSELELVLVSDLLSGDTEARQVGLLALHRLLDHDSLFPLKVGFSRKRSPHAGDLLADNVAGWFNECIQNPQELDILRAMPDSNELTGWEQLYISDDGQLSRAPVLGQRT